MKSCPTCLSTYPDDFALCPRDGTRLAAQFKGAEAEIVAQLASRFRLLSRLGRGGFGTVFLAEQIAVGNRLVALKVLSGQALDGHNYFERFQNEAASAGRIHHPNVVTIYDYNKADDGTPYIAMEFLEGEALSVTLRRRGALPLLEVADILSQVARGLSAAHRLGIIHRDLKPDNILLTRGDEGELVVKVVDFGIAKLREDSSHTLTGAYLGTPAYMSCEQALGMSSDELDARSDIYSLGVVVYEMLSGRVPFHADTLRGYMRKHELEAPPPFRALAPDLDVPGRVEAVVMKALVKDRDQRYASALDFASAFAAATQPSPRAENSVRLDPTLIVSPPTAEVANPLGATIDVSLLKRRQPGAPMPLSSRPSTSADIAARYPPPTPPETIVQAPRPQSQVSKPFTASVPPAESRPPQFATLTEPPGKMKVVAMAVVILILIVAGVWYFSSSRNPPVGNPQGGIGASPTATGQQGPGAESLAPSSQNPPGNQTNAADILQQVEAAKRQGDNYYFKGEYDRAISAYQGGLKLDHSNAQLLQGLRRAETAKATEEKVNQ